MYLVVTTVATTDEAAALARGLVDAGLAGCVQTIAGVSSTYLWQGEVRTDQEHLLLIKTLAEKYGEVEEFIRSRHSYDTPEIIGIDVDRADAAYVTWLESCF